MPLNYWFNIAPLTPHVFPLFKNTPQNQDSPSVFDNHNEWKQIIQLTLINTIIFDKVHED